ncbi:MAG TPA: hypothetical protein VFU59_03815 [Candidatus Eisenbacteria bacterium]|nr:hypothetical protein [Candidatus Eisenbacteria bacterium]
MKKGFLAVMLALLVLPAAAHAQRDLSGKLALGYWDPEAPIGGRYVISPRAAVDIGFGFAQQYIGDDPTTAAANDDKKNMQLHIAAGVPLTLVSRDKVNFFFRPGFLFKFIPTYNRPTALDPYEKKTETETEITGILGAEWFATDDLSFSVGHGLKLTSSKGVSANDTTTGDLESQSFLSGLEALDITAVGFHFYF